jgi:hypothetical protein
VAIIGLQTIVVADYHILTVTTRLIFYNANLTAESSTDGIANIHLDIEALVLATPAGTEIRSYHAARRRHTETAQINGSLVGESYAIVMGELVVPLIIQIVCGVLEHFLLNQSIEYYGVDCLHLPVNGSLTS